MHALLYSEGIQLKSGVNPVKSLFDSVHSGRSERVSYTFAGITSCFVSCFCGNINIKPSKKDLFLYRSLYGFIMLSVDFSPIEGFIK